MSKILFMPVGFYEYDKIISKTTKNMGYDVTEFSPMASYGKLWQKIANVLTKGKYINKRAYRLQKKFYEECNEEFDYVLAIVGRDINPTLFSKFKEKQKKAKFILYLWDDLHLTKNYEPIKGFFDEIYSFSPQDSEKYGFKYLPNFYTEYFNYSGQEKEYLLSMMGTSHSGRIDLWIELIQKYNIPAEKAFLYLLPVGMSSYVNGKYLLKKNNMKTNGIRIYGVPLKESAEIMCKSKVALDVQVTSQTGITMRTLESMAAKTKLITTNTFVKQYDFYNPNNICIIDKDNPVIPRDFLESPYEDVSKEIMDNYTVEHWVATILQ